MKQSKVPLEVRRRAADHLESIRESGLGLNVEDLYLGDDVTPIYRPDLEEPAYYEFQLVKGTRERPDGRTDLVEDVSKTNVVDADGYTKVYESAELRAAGRRTARPTPVQGFITVTAGDHDFPVPHWSLEQAPVSVHLEGEAKKRNKSVGRVYKLDALAYVAEDSDGHEVAGVGEPPYLVQDAPEDLSSFEGRIGFAVPEDLSRSEEPDLPKMRGKPLKQGGARPAGVKVDKARSWGALKKQYGKALAPELKALRDRAGKAWKVEHAIHDYGEGIRAGDVQKVPLLERGFSARVSGEAAQYVHVRVVKRPGDMPCIELSCDDPGLGREASFSLHLAYGGRQEEELKFFVYTPDIPTRNAGVAEEQ